MRSPPRRASTCCGRFPIFGRCGWASTKPSVWAPEERSAPRESSNRRPARSRIALTAPPPEPLAVEVDGVVRRFRIVTAAGRIPDDLLADRPVEERGRGAWRLTWVLPLDDDLRPNPLTRTVIGAPTPTDEPLTLPALLVGTFPVDDTRRHLARGPLADHLIERAVDAYQDLVLSARRTIGSR